MIIPIVIGNLELSKVRAPDFKGYIPLNKTLTDEKIDTLPVINYTIDKNKIRALKDIISTCKQMNINLILVYSPIRRVDRSINFNAIISELCFKNDISYFDMSNNPTFINNPQYFADKTHLNIEGAKVFTNMLINIIWQAN